MIFEFTLKHIKDKLYLNNRIDPTADSILTHDLVDHSTKDFKIVTWEEEFKALSGVLFRDNHVSKIEYIRKLIIY